MHPQAAGKRLRAIVLAAGTAMILVLAGMPGATRAAHPAASGKLVYFIFTGFTYPYFAPMAKGIQAVAKLYPDLNIKIVSANNSASTEISQINEAVANGAQGILLNPVQESVTHVAQQVMAKGIPVITIDRDLSNPAARVAFIGDKDVLLGQEQTTYALQYLASHKVPKPWNVAILEGTLGASTAIDRLTGEMNALKPYLKNGSAKIILNQSANFMTSVAQTTISELLAKTHNIQLIICGNDAMALGAITALKDQKITPGKGTYVVGADAQPESLAAVKAGTQLDTVTHSPFLEAVWSVEAMSAYLANKTAPSASKYPQGFVVIPMTVVNSANVAGISAWGTPSMIPPLPYGNGKPVKAS